ncbi:hypothetical protein VP01_9174g2, partial [Puccinia sorghi]
LEIYILNLDHYTAKNAAKAFANTNEKRAKATLVICPLSTLANWETEIHKHLELNITKYTVYHGEERKRLTRTILWDHKILIATNNTVSNHYKSGGGVLPEDTPGFRSEWKNGKGSNFFSMDQVSTH